MSYRCLKMNFDFEISRVDLIFQNISWGDKVENLGI